MGGTEKMTWCGERRRHREAALNNRMKRRPTIRQLENIRSDRLEEYNNLRDELLDINERLEEIENLTSDGLKNAEIYEEEEDLLERKKKIEKELRNFDIGAKWWWMIEK